MRYQLQHVGLVKGHLGVRMRGRVSPLVVHGNQRLLLGRRAEKEHCDSCPHRSGGAASDCSRDNMLVHKIMLQEVQEQVQSKGYRQRISTRRNTTIVRATDSKRSSVRRI